MAHSLSRVAPAKINLCLHVTGQRPDGYHLLESLVVFTQFGDRLTVSPSSEDEFTITGPQAPGLPVGSENLVLRARDLLRQETGHVEHVAIKLEKNLPAASGMGGGSSDAASTLILLNALWKLGLKQDRLARIALKLGADVPMCLSETPLIARGIGEDITPLSAVAELSVLLVNPGVPVSTPEIFRKLERKENPPLPPLTALDTAPALFDWLHRTRNDLQEPATRIQPEISHCLSALLATGAELVRMTGSGATCFGLFSSQEAAERAREEISASHPDWFVVATSLLHETEAFDHV